MTALVMLLPFAGGLLVGAILVGPFAHRAGVRSAARDTGEIARILDGVAVPVVRPAIVPHAWAQKAAEVWVNPAPRAITPVRHGSQRVARTPATYRPRHSALILAHLKADTHIGRPPVVAELVMSA